MDLHMGFPMESVGTTVDWCWFLMSAKLTEGQLGEFSEGSRRNQRLCNTGSPPCSPSTGSSFCLFNKQHVAGCLCVAAVFKWISVSVKLLTQMNQAHIFRCAAHCFVSLIHLDCTWQHPWPDSGTFDKTIKLSGDLGQSQSVFATGLPFR